ncbi:hypothetical protein SAMN03159496_02216 [Rhizobium sp. NFR07]|uniref:hypothetical protein n=1 Tax=Rhizobium sp. NFR07 TaxID=1566262 RepID=UPI0008F3FEA1|nr:hypothetical protein [Rhizobium sp. NFR07]SFB18474.1 hypothetical protein SAMN03159496_02216 [Rhizobium sp. NFR07]
MTFIAGTNSAALLILTQANSVNSPENEKARSDTLVAVANGVGGKVGASLQPGQAESKISEAMFSVNNVNINKLKLDLIDRAATALGFDESDYETRGQFVSAMRVELVKIAADEGGEQKIAAMEKKLGLDKLGVSLMDVVSSARNPEANDRVTQALEEREGVDKEKDEKKDERDDDTPSSFQPDEMGIYGGSVL